MPHELGSSDAAGQHRRPADAADRRTVRRVAAFGAAAVAVTALATAGVASGAGAGGSSAGSGGGAPGTPGAAPTASASASAKPAGSASPGASAAAEVPQLKIQIAYSRVGRNLTLTFNFAGHVVEPLNTDGTKLSFPTPAKRDIGLGETLAWGDGTNSDVPVSGRRCPVDKEARVIHEISDSYQAEKTYTAPGTYTVNYTYFACGLTGGKISGTLTITIPK